jgi:hypothetical protein
VRAREEREADKKRGKERRKCVKMNGGRRKRQLGGLRSTWRRLRFDE